MSDTQAKARGKEAVPSAPEMKSAADDFMCEFNGFQSDIAKRLKQQEERLTMLDRKTQTHNRPHLARAAELEAPHQKAFNAYLRSGDDDGLRGLELEGKAMSSAVAADGGYLVDPETSESIRSVLESTSSIRAIANVVRVEATSFDVLVDHSDVGAGWATETDPSSETGTPQIDRITIPLHELSALPKASQRLLDDSAFDIEGWLAARIANKFARSEAAAFINGNGIDKPTGMLTHPTVDNDTWTWGNLGYVATGVAGDFDGGEAVIDLVYALGAQYRANASFVMNSKTAGALRKLKDADGRFLWSDGLAAGEPARLLGYPVLIAEDMPDLRVLRDPFSAKPHVLFYATKRVGGDVSDFAAIKLLKFGTS